MQLHLNPVHAVVQLRPSKRNLKESELKKNIITNNDEKSVENEDVKEKRPVGPSKKQVHFMIFSVITAPKLNIYGPCIWPLTCDIMVWIIG